MELLEKFVFLLETFVVQQETRKRRVKATTSGNERTRLSAAYSGTASGRKLPIYMIINRKRIHFIIYGDFI